MKDNIININLETSTAPIIQEQRGKDWIEFGTEDWKNLYPQFIIDLYYSSSISAAIINATAEYISAENLVIEDEDDRDLEARIKLQNFMNRANGNESLHEVIKKIAFDFKLQGAFALNIVWSKDHTEIAEIYHVGVEKVRCARPDEFGKTNDCLVVYDYLKLMSSSSINNNMQEYQALGFQITNLHNLAVKLDFPCLSFVQLNRDGITKESTDAVSGSDRLNWLCTSFSIFKLKSAE